MKLSIKSLYAVRALFHMAYHAPSSTTRVAHIAEAEGISAGFLDQIFQALRKAGVVGSKRGPQGGYFLARPLDAITLGEIVRVIEGETEHGLCKAPREEAEGLPTEAPPEATGLMVTEEVWREVAGQIDAILDAYTLQDLVSRGQQQGLAREDFSSFIYII